MPTTTAGDVSLLYETDGDGETVTFVNDAGLGAWLWSWQYDRLAGPYRTVVWDLRGTGNSETPPGPYTVDQLAGDLEAILKATETAQTHLVGAGLGGMVALRYARTYNRARTLTLFGTAASGEAVDEASMRDLYCSPEADRAAMQASLEGAFSRSFLDTQPDLVDQICTWRQSEDAPSAGFEAQLAAMTAFESGPLYEWTIPTLVCHGLDDPVVPASAGRALAEDLPRGTFEAVEGRHCCFVEHARPVTDRLLAFLEEQADE